jgi:hypothetical protein
MDGGYVDGPVANKLDGAGGVDVVLLLLGGGNIAELGGSRGDMRDDAVGVGYVEDMISSDAPVTQRTREDAYR